MSQPSCYMDDVPVKISDKYKPPACVILPASINQNIATAKYLIDSLDYDFSLETNVLKKLEEIRALKESQEAERKHRLQLIEEEKQRKVDLIIAAEEEEKLKQLSVSDVSYPSTDESDEISPDDNVDEEVTVSQFQPNLNHVNTLSESTVMSPLENKDSQYDSPKSASPFYPTIESTVRVNKEQDNILKPTLISSFANINPTNLLDDPNPIRGMQQNVDKYSVLKMVNIRNNVQNLTYSDFEHDTSSPFDNMELKTINEMEMLAQVLNTQQTAITDYRNNTVVPASDSNHTNCINYQDGYAGYYNTNGGVNFQTPTTTTYCNDLERIPNNTNIHGLAANFSTSNGILNINSETVGNANIPNGYYDPSYGYYHSNYQNPHNLTYGVQNNLNYNNSDYFTSKNVENTSTNGSTYLQRNNDPYSGVYNYAYPNSKVTDYSSYLPPQDESSQTGVDNVVEQGNEVSLKSRSRSVPDIIKELDEEITSARIRMKERSHNASPAPSPVRGLVDQMSKIAVSSSGEQKTFKDNLQRPFNSLPRDLQTLCKYISSMGFPLERVARACQVVGSNDKKVIEYLLTMGELMDLGFAESQVASALVTNDFNRDKALDDLVS